MLAVVQRLDGRVDDMGWSFEVGLTDAEIDDVAPLALSSAALASTAKAFSSPIRPKAGLIAINCGRSLKAASFGKGGGGEQGEQATRGTPEPN